MSAGGTPKPPLQRRGGRTALSRKPGNRLTPVRRVTTNVRTQKTGPMCIGRRLLEPCAHGAGLIVAAFSARDILRCVKLTSEGDRDTAAALVCGAYFFIFLVFLATFLVALAVFFAFFAFFAMSSSWGLLA